ncbi:MAG: NACHT domain-containing protein [Leptolyngbyaceae cyanobacterium SM1_4_3]|nr:NACHT domain-containing protein [Leptolyngbyaceae cyanobacterium SM1_4_3]
MMDWLIVWGAVEAAGILVKPVLEDLAKDSTKDYAKDFFKDCLKKVIRLPEKDVQKEAYGKALKEFLELVQQELENAGYQEAQVKQYIQPFKQFVDNGQVSALLGQAFESECRMIDTRMLAQTWRGLDLPYLPDDFDWDLVSKPYVRKVKAIIQNSDVLRPIFAAEAQSVTAESLQELVGIAPAFDLRCYAEGLREQYGNLKLESLDTTGVYYNELKLWKVFVPQNVRECQEFLPQVYEIPKEHLRRLRERGELSEAELAEAELEKHRRVYVEQPIRSVLEVVGDPTIPVGANGRSPVPHVVVLGDPGSGKSSLLQYLALIWAERPLSELPLYPIPLLIELRTYARDKREKKCSDILSFIHSGNIVGRLNQQHLHEKLKAGHAIALFDGVDEVFDPALRDEVVMDIHRFTNEYPEVQAIATSRSVGYKVHQLRSAGFRHFMLQDLEPEQIEDFIQRWHNLTFPAGLDKTRKQERLHKAIQESNAIRELAGNPLLLTMMAILNRNQELPRNRPELYNQASRVLLHQWDVERNLIEHRLDPLTINYQDKQAMLRQVAYHMQSSEKGLAGNIISATDLENILMDYLRTIDIEQPRTIARLMIEHLRTRNFILCDLGADSYGFVHRTFLEYFCATEFVNQFEKQQSLTFEQLQEYVFGSHWHDERWHEVLQLIISMLGTNNAGKIINYIIDRNINCGDFCPWTDDFIGLFLATKCLSGVRNRRSIDEVENRLLKLMKDLAEHFAPNSPMDCQTELANLIVKVRGQAVKAVATTWRCHHETLAWLKSLAQFGFSGDDGTAQAAAIHELAREWNSDPETYKLIQLLASETWVDEFGDVVGKVQVAAIQELARNWKNDSETLKIIQKFASSKEYGYLQAMALKELVKGWKDDPNTLSLLKNLIQLNEINYMWLAVQEMAREWKDNSETLSFLRSCTALTLSPTKDALMQELLRSWQKSNDVYNFLYECASDNSFTRPLGFGSKRFPRFTALKAIVEEYSTHSKTLELLRDRATNDPDEQVREFAKQQLSELEALKVDSSKQQRVDERSSL